MSTEKNQPEEEIIEKEIVDESIDNTPDDSTQEKEEIKEEETDSFQKKYEEVNDKYLRLYSEFENYRRRTAKEKIDLISNAGESILKDLIPVLDDFERAIETNKTAEDLDALKEGFQLLYQKYKGILTQKGLKEMEAKEQDFDVELHEALTKIPAPSKKLKGKVVDVMEKGYYLNDKVIRYAKVVIGE